LALLQDTRLFNIYDSGGVAMGAQEALARRSCVAKWADQLVFVIHRYMRYKVPTCDVGRLSEISPGRYRMGKVESCPARDLTGPRPADVHIVGGNVLEVETGWAVAPSQVSSADPGILAAALRHMEETAPRPTQKESVQIMPATAEAHVELARRHGEKHVLQIQDRNISPVYVLDFPSP